MFATLKIGFDHQGPVCVESYTNPPGEQLQSPSQQHSACTACRNNKLKCTGHRNGCDRCRAKGTTCTYLTSTKARRPRRRSYQRSLAGSHKSSQTLAIDQDNIQIFEKSKGPLPSPQSSTIHSMIDGLHTARPMTDFTKSSNESISAHAREAGCYGVHTPMSGPATEEEKLDVLEHDSSPGLVSSEELASDLLNFDFDVLASLGHQQNNEGPGVLQSSDFQETHSSSSYLTEVPDQEKYSTFDSPPWSDNTLSQRPKHSSFQRDDSHMLGSPGVTPCQCMQNILLLHEEVESKRTEDCTMAMLDYRLSFQKHVLDQCSGILECKDCRERSSIAMLLISICERLCRLFKNLLKSFSNKLLHEQQRRWLCSPRLKVSGNDSPGCYQKVCIGDYNVQAPEEQLLLTMRAVELQIRGFLGLQLQLRTIAMSYGWKKHISILSPIQKQTQQIVLGLKNVASNELYGPLHDG